MNEKSIQVTDPVFKKLNFKNHDEIFVLNAPDSFHPHTETMKAITRVHTAHDGQQKISFGLIFVKEQEEIEFAAENIIPHLEGDAVFWAAYPKKSSKKYTCNFNRDSGWDPFGEKDLEGVRQVSVDEDWSALRFRKTQFIQKITRRESFAISKSGKNRTTQKGK